MKYRVAAILSCVFLQSGHVRAGDTGQVRLFSGYRLPRGLGNAQYYDFVMHVDQSVVGRDSRPSWSFLKYTLRVWQDRDEGKLEILRLEGLSSTEEVNKLMARATRTTVAFTWRKEGLPSSVPLRFPEGTQEDTKKVAEPLSREFLPRLFKSFPTNAALKVGAQWGDHSRTDSVHTYASKATVEGWKVEGLVSAFSNRWEFLVTGTENDTYLDEHAPASERGHSSSRFEVYHYDACAMRNRLVAMHFTKESGIAQDGEYGGRRDRTHVVISELTNTNPTVEVQPGFAP